MALTFEWDPAKARSNLAKHRVDFPEAIFGDPLSFTVPDPDHSVSEQRYVTMGFSFRRRLLVVAHTEWETASGSSQPAAPRARNGGTKTV